MGGALRVPQNLYGGVWELRDLLVSRPPISARVLTGTKGPGWHPLRYMHKCLSSSATSKAAAPVLGVMDKSNPAVMTAAAASALRKLISPVCPLDKPADVVYPFPTNIRK